MAKDCEENYKCYHCGEGHSATSWDCKEHKRQKNINTLMAEQNLSAYEARQICPSDKQKNKRTPGYRTNYEEFPLLFSQKASIPQQKIDPNCSRNITSLNSPTRLITQRKRKSPSYPNISSRERENVKKIIFPTTDRVVIEPLPQFQNYSSQDIEVFQAETEELRQEQSSDIEMDNRVEETATNVDETKKDFETVSKTVLKKKKETRIESIRTD